MEEEVVMEAMGVEAGKRGEEWKRGEAGQGSAAFQSIGSTLIMMIKAEYNKVMC